MGSYAEPLTAEQYKEWQKQVKIWLINNDMDKKDLGDAIGYSYKTVIDALSHYERCSRFFIAAVNDQMGRKK